MDELVVKPLKNERYKYVILSIIIMMLLGTVYSYSVFRPFIEEAYGIGSTHSGLPYMASLASYALFMFFTGRVMERYKAKHVLLFGSLLMSLGWVLSYFAKDIYTLTMTYGIIAGAGVGIAYGVPMSVVAKWFPEKKGLAVGFVLVGFGLSPLIIAPIAKYLAVEMGIKNTFLMIGMTYGILLPFLAYPFEYPKIAVVENAENEVISHHGDLEYDTRLMVKSRAFKFLYINFIIGTMIGLMMIGMTTSVGMEYSLLKSETVTVLISLFAIFNGIGRPLYGWLTDYFGVWKTMRVSYGMIFISSILFLTMGQHNAAVYIIGYAIYWLNLGGWLAIAPTATMKMFGLKNYGKNYGLMFTAYGIGAISGVLTSGMIIDHHGDYRLVFGYILILCVLGYISTYLIKNK